jgi:nucleotide-binding universal stress UspA family protein
MKLTDAKTRISLKSILYLTDFSPVAEGAAPFALALARRYGAKVFALHVRAPQAYGMAPPESWPVLEEAANALAKDQVKHLGELFAGVEHHAMIEEGDVWDAASALIEKNDVDLIVLGTHGRKGIEKVLLGSVAEKIFRLAPCPVLTVGPHVRSDANRAAEVKRILYATTFSPASLCAAAYAISLAQENQAHLDILHVIEDHKTGELVDPCELKIGCEQRMRSLVPRDAELWCEPSFMVEVGKPAGEILSAARRLGADMIVLGLKSTSALGAATHLPWAIAHKIISNAECPVLTVRS